MRSLNLLLPALLLPTVFLEGVLRPLAAAERLTLEAVVLELPAAPAVVLDADVDGDGYRDLVAAVVFDTWDQETVEEHREMDDVQGLVEVMTIVPVLADRRELVMLPGTADGWRAPGLRMPLGTEVHALLPGPDGAAVLALTDDGVSVLRRSADTLGLEPLVESPTLLAGTGVLVPDLELTADLDGDGRLDLLLPTLEGLAVHRALTEGGLAATATVLVPWPAGERGTPWARRFPLPEIRDVDADGLPDLLFPDPKKGWEALRWSRNRGSGHFDPPGAPLEPPPFCEPEDGEDAPPDLCRPPGRIVWIGDVDGDGAPEALTQESLENPDAGAREEIRQAKRPPYRYRILPADRDLAIRGEPERELEAIGYTFTGGGGDGDSVPLPGGLQDLDGDGDLDLVALTLDFSLLQAARVMTTGTFGLGLDFHLYCQDEDGRFRPVEGLDLSGKLRLDLDDLRLSHRSLFGDFDGDGRADFVQLGRGRDVAIHLGREGCRVSETPDLVLRLEEEPANLALVRVEDLDGDGRSDLAVLQPGKRPEDGASRPVRLEIYRSRAPGVSR